MSFTTEDAQDSTQSKSGNYKASHIDEDLRGQSLGDRENELFYNCTFDTVKGATLKDCCLENSKFLVSNLQDCLGLTLTLDCKSFGGVEFSELMFDALLVLLTKTKGNTLKRKKIVALLGRERFMQLLLQMERIER